MKECVFCKKEKKEVELYKKGNKITSYCIECFSTEFENETKICNTCNIEKPLISKYFPKSAAREENSSVPYYYLNKCKECYKKERLIKYNESERKYARISYKMGTKGQLLKRAKYRSINENLPFNLTLDDIYIPKKCPILNIPLFICKGKAGDNSPSLDKINPSLGYIPGNVKVISRMANIMKAHATKEQLELFSKNILIYLQDYKVQNKSDKLLETPEEDNQQPS